MDVFYYYCHVDSTNGHLLNISYVTPICTSVESKYIFLHIVMHPICVSFWRPGRNLNEYHRGPLCKGKKLFDK